ncbi:alpha-N-acetylglucosaminidase-like [Uloborus diversus]|uniref:alpha-N-acetylglucosaminidase-like n=1 Tax=Uloborus diversus TaxID=327109 RepID=UPI002409E053|nr:alpha-N-acetylglucosaminidase-like [Uloborus diversus]
MALNGINLPLAFTAQEAITEKVFKMLNFTQNDIDAFFTGPAFLAWNRMGNVQSWAGPLSENWHKVQVKLQHQILDRMRSFGMTTVLPAFSGRVVPSFSRLYPNASITSLGNSWGHFLPPFSNVSFLEPTDPLFQEIGGLFLKEYIKEFGTDHVYNADLFNEMPPPSNDPNYLKACSKSVYSSLTKIDPDAIWLTQGWMFYSDPDIWKEPQAKAFLEGVPIGKMIVLDLQSELYPQYHRLQSYYGQPFIWCMLHNYGGVIGLYGSMESINMGPFDGRTINNSTMVGTGITPEGIETNDAVYELMNEIAWRKAPANLDEWLKQYTTRRYGHFSSNLLEAWKYLKKSVYNATVPYRNHGKYILIQRPSLKLKPYVWYDPKDVFAAWRLFVNASEELVISKQKLFRHDLVDVTRQSMQLVMDFLYSKYVQAFRQKNIRKTRKTSQIILKFYNDTNDLLLSDEGFLLGKWLDAAKSFARTPEERRQYEYNARNQITLWGPTGQILDYANKQWAGLITAYYQQRWKLFFEVIDDCLVNRKPFKQSDFNKIVLLRVEMPFGLGDELYPTLSEVAADRYPVTTVSS